MRETNDAEIRTMAEFIAERIPELPQVALITGSGLAALGESVEHPVVIETSGLAGYPQSTVAGHPGKLLFGRIGGVPAMVVQGRVHGYEGYSLDVVVIPVRLAAALGCRAMILTTASGGIADELHPGDLMRITDHVNLLGGNPLTGRRWGFEQFPDMTDAYSKRLGVILDRVAGEQGIEVKRGVFAAVFGPSYETPAEIHFLKQIGVSAVSMSTVPEVIAAARLRLPILAVTYISNLAAGRTDKMLTHEEVTEMGARVGEKFSRLLVAGIREIARMDEE